jgi:nucleolar protein 4
MYEGHITQDMPAAQGMSAAELQKRQRLWAKKLDKLGDTNNKVSKTRLAIFNLPETSGTGQVRKIFAVAPEKYARTHKTEEISKEIMAKTVRIPEVRVVEEQKGVAFVEFKEHVHALGALREVNNNPKYFPGRRLIVEFAIENNFATKERRKKEKAKKAKREKRFAEREPPTRESDEQEEGEE